MRGLVVAALASAAAQVALVSGLHHGPMMLSGHPFARAHVARLEAARADELRTEDDPVLPAEQWFTQRVDHFDALNQDTYQQR